MKRATSLFCIILLLSLELLAQQAAQSVADTPEKTAPASKPVASKPAPSGPTLEDGTPLKLRISETVSSADAHVGQMVSFEVLEEVKVSDVVVVPKGGVAWATVTEAQAKRRMGRGGKLNMNIDAVRLANGEKVALRAIKEVKGGGHVGAMTGAMVATGIVFFPAAPLFLFMHGKDITIPKGTEITAFVNGDVPLDLAKFRTAATGATVADALPKAAEEVLEFSSNPAGADIEVDGNFVGTTPSSLSVGPGDHAITIRKSGYKAWERKMKTSTGSVKVAAELEQEAKVEILKPDAGNGEAIKKE